MRDIDPSFATIKSSELSALRHPIPRELVAFEIFPDVDIWANTYV